MDLAEGAVGCYCHLLRSVHVSSCHEGLRAQCCVTVPGWQTRMPGEDSRREPLSVKHNATCWEEEIHLNTAHFLRVIRFE